MMRSAVCAAMVLLLAASLASPAGARSERGWPHTPRARARSALAVLRHDCLQRCKSNYEINVGFCTNAPRGGRKECRAEESWNRRDCVARCRR